MNDTIKDIIREKTNAFDRLWKEHYSTIPPLDKCPSGTRDIFKVLAKKIYLDAVHDDLMNIYNAGFEDGKYTKSHETNLKLERIKEKIVYKLDDCIKNIQEECYTGI